MSGTQDSSMRLLWARFRFSIVGTLLSDPPEHGLLRERLQALAGKSWRHPTTGEAVRYGVSTIELRISLNVITEIGIMISHFGDCDRCHWATGRNEVTRG